MAKYKIIKKKIDKIKEIIPDGYKKCSGICQQIKPTEEFVIGRNQCKKCKSKGIVKEDLESGFKRCITGNPHCNKIKPLSDFPKAKTCIDGRANQCKKCKAEYKKIWNENNPDYFKQYREIHGEELKESHKQWRDKNPDKCKEQWRKRYYKDIEETKKRNNSYQKQRRDNDPEYKLLCSMRNILERTHKLIGTKKENRTNEELGYTPEKLKLRLSVNFTDQMYHDTYGKLKDGTWGWEIDHVIPPENFIKKGKTDPKIINALPNLKPRWRTSRTINGVFYLGNIEKSNKIIHKEKSDKLNLVRPK